MRSLALAFLLLAAASAPAPAMRLTSSDFSDGGTIPAVHLYPRCGGQNVSPELSWKGVPATAKSLYLTMIDIDVQPNLWTHWIVLDLPPDSTGMPRGTKTLPEGAHGVVSNFGDAVYDGPCPPEGNGTHHYQFTLWAISRTGMHLGGNISARALQAALSQLAIDHATITGTVRR
jgi:Raf kinase inhibitor-like YbhB/YbcL family protein